MNLHDLERMARAAFPMDGDRAFSLVEMAWKAGKRSGHASTTANKEGKVGWNEWDWAEEQKELVRYARKHYFDEDVPGAVEFVDEQLRGAENWAKSKAEKRPDWTAFMKTWLDRSIKTLPPRPTRQHDLFGKPSTPSSATSTPQSMVQNDRRTENRSAAAIRLLHGGKR